MYRYEKIKDFREASPRGRSDGVKIAYRVHGLDPKIFKGLKLEVVMVNGCWSFNEETTGNPIMPASWSGGWTNKNRAGAIALLGDYLSRLSPKAWSVVQSMLDYPLSHLPAVPKP